jgi:CMP-N,N'-diacetyllegionaminic acid synthase
MRVLGIIPARGGSKGVPRKNLKKLNGLPLIKYTLDAALNSNLSELVVSTEDEEIANFAKLCGCKVPFFRPLDLASDTASSIDVAIHALNAMEEITHSNFDAIMLLQPTTPFRSNQDINDALSLISHDEKASSVISVVDVKAHHPARMKYIENGVLIDPDFCEKYENQNRQELQPMYIRNGAVYLTKRETILSSSFKGLKSLALIMPEERSVNIDTLSDFELAEWTLTKK